MLRALLEDAETDAAATAKAKRVRLTIHLETDRELDVDVRLVHSALTNLVRNAVKFTHEGGHVEVRASSEGDRTSSRSRTAAAVYHRVRWNGPSRRS